MSCCRFLVIFTFHLLRQCEGNWHEWWTYDGISGPAYWGVINPSWPMCSKGQQQSPIDVNPKRLVFDPTLKPVSIDKQPISGVLYNTGQSLVFRTQTDRLQSLPVNISGGPLSYNYQFEEIYFHWGSGDDSSNSGLPGSEHSIDGYFFPAEIQIFGFNSILFKNVSEALKHPHGVVAISVMVQESERTIRNGFGPITNHLKKVIYRGQNFPVSDLNLQDLLPSTSDFMTYEGSLTFPGCWESVTWILMNKPIYVSSPELYALRQLQQGDKQQPKAPMANNNRPIQQLNERSIRTNIIFAAPQGSKHDFQSRLRSNQEDNNIYGMETFYSLKAQEKANDRGQQDGGVGGGGLGTSVVASIKTKNKKKKHGNNSKCPEVAKDMYYKANNWMKD